MSTSSSTPLDGFSIKPESPTADAHHFLTEWLNSLPPDHERWWSLDLQKSDRLKCILEASPEEQLLYMVAVIERVAWNRKAEAENFAARRAQKPLPYSEAVRHSGLFFRDIWRPLARRKLPWTPELLEASFSAIAENHSFDSSTTTSMIYPIDMLLRVAKQMRETRPLPAGLRQAVRRIQQSLSDKLNSRSADDRRLCQALSELLASPATTPFDPAEAWAKDAQAQIAALPAEPQSNWSQLLQHAAQASGSAPSKKWLATAKALLAKVGSDDFASRVPGWFTAVTAPKPKNAMEYFGKSPMREANASILKGLAWMSGLMPDKQMADAVGDLALKCFTKVPGYGPLNTKVANACLRTLESLPGHEPVAYLSRLRQKAKTRSVQDAVQTALDNAARERKVTADELEEMSIPTCGLDEQGILRQKFGNSMAEVRLLDSGKTAQAWFNSTGKPVKSPPAEVTGQFATELKDLKRTVKDIEAIVAAQRLRIERLLVADRAIPLTAWRERYLDHVMVAPLARRLIWQFKRDDRVAAGIWHEGKLVDVRDRALDWIDPETSVSFWHPLTAKMEIVQAWREWLENHEIAQPFKQAHREIYIITDAERGTGEHSNRFAAHIIRQHQFAALARQRGWQYHLQGMFDSANTPTLRLPRWKLQAEFWVEPGTNHDASDAGMHLLLTTDQVRFLDERNRAVPLVEVPPLAFSEVMRDVDLFIGVASVGSDPNWVSGGPRDHHHDYWHAYSFGDLNATAKTRRDVLQRMLPKLKIAGCCALEERFLVVKGSLRSYKIHLGSGNILMEPNDQYLCIVANRDFDSAKPVNVFLPFENDNTLSVILSKAFLLAEDSKIKDQSILRQIKG